MTSPRLAAAAASTRTEAEVRAARIAARPWRLKQARRIHCPHPFLLIMVDEDGGFCRYGHERFTDRATALLRAKALVEQGYRIDVVKDVAHSERSA